MPNQIPGMGYQARGAGGIETRPVGGMRVYWKPRYRTLGESQPYTLRDCLVSTPRSVPLRS